LILSELWCVLESGSLQAGSCPSAKSLLAHTLPPLPFAHVLQLCLPVIVLLLQARRSRGI
jgi:hypothetical protein